MKSVFLFFLLVVSTPLFAVNESFTDYLNAAERRAKGLVNTYFGSSVYVSEFEQVPGGAFLVKAQSQEGESYSLYMLGDMETLIYGTLITKHITDISQANGLPALEKIAKRNQDKERLVEESRTYVSKYRAGTAASLLSRDDFETASQTSPELSKFLAKLPSTNSQRSLIEQIGALEYVSFGHGDKELFVFFDLNCPACQQELPHLMQIAEDGEVVVKVVPVAFLKPVDSIDKAIHVLTDITDTGRQERLLNLAQSKPFSALVPDSTTVVDINAVRAVQENNELFYSLPNKATPYFVAQTESGLVTAAMTSQSKVALLIDSITPIAAQIMQSEGQPIPKDPSDL